MLPELPQALLPLEPLLQVPQLLPLPLPLYLLLLLPLLLQLFS